ncbi:MAG TPA: Rieske 2Fe-2S domain-containing protein [Candidatus Binataceae bacterium]|nr:Rieske 2Fe-2S domain-containing protein [Candidatus Binataceae bacterium]
MTNEIGAEQLVDGCRVSRRVYTEGEVFALEMDRIFGRGWVFLCHESEVAAPGEFRTIQIGTQPAIVTRDERGEVRVLMNHCMHRGATICQQSRGQTKNFRCWYHGWTYNLRGELIGVPYAEAYGPEFDRSQRGLLKPARVEHYRGMVFASLADEVENLVDYLAGAKRYLDVFMDLSPRGEIEARAGGHKFTYEGNWKFQLENGVDGYHPNFVHRSFWEMQPEGAMDIFTGSSPGLTRALGNGHSILDMSPLVKPAGSDGRPPANPLPSDGLKPAPTGDYFDQLVRAWGHERAIEVLEQSNVNLLIFPNLLIIGVQLRTITPVDVTTTEVYQQPTTLKGVADEMNVSRLRTHEVFYGPAALGAPDDLEMFTRCSRGMQVQGREWITFDRGLQRERVEHGERIGQITDEVPQRAFYRQWRKLIAARAGEVAHAGGNGHTRAPIQPS